MSHIGYKTIIFFWLVIIETKQTPYPSLRHSLLFSSTKSETSGILSGDVPDPDIGNDASESNPSVAEGFEARLLKASTRLWISFEPGLELVAARGKYFAKWASIYLEHFWGARGQNSWFLVGKPHFDNFIKRKLFEKKFLVCWEEYFIVYTLKMRTHIKK